MARWLFIAARNFGDALISRRLIRAVADSHPDDPVDILTREAFRTIFEPLGSRVSLIPSVFPMGTMKQFGPGGALHLTRIVTRLRRIGYDTTVNDRGDVRECLLGRLVGGRRNAGPVWAPQHPFRRLIRDRGAHRCLNTPLPIPEHVVNIYEAGDLMTRLLGATPTGWGSAPVVTAAGNTPLEIAIHPFATQECRMWPWSHWRTLATSLHQRGWPVSIFGSMKDRPVLEREFTARLPSGTHRIITGTLPEFFDSLSKSNLLIALDSFAIHTAFSLGIPAIMINGANDHRLWTPPGTVALVNGGRCPHYPCYCAPRCPDGTVTRFACVEGISPESVIRAVDQHLVRPGGKVLP